MQFAILDRLDPGMRALMLVLAGGSASWVVGPLILFVTRDLALVTALLGLVALASLIVVIWGLYFAVRVLRGDDYGQRIPAQLAAVIGALTLLPWLVAMFS